MSYTPIYEDKRLKKKKKDGNFPNMAKLMIKSRNAIGLSQADTVYLLGLRNAQYLSNCERHLCSMAPKRFNDIARVLEIDVSELIKADLEDRRWQLERIINQTKPVLPVV